MTHAKRIGPLAPVAVAAALFAFAAPRAHAATTGSFDRTLPVSTAAVNLQIESGAGHINVRPGAAGSVHVVARIYVNNWSNGWFGELAEEIDEFFHGAPRYTDAQKIQMLESNPPIVQNGNVIAVGHIDDEDLRRNITIDYDVTAPPQTQLTSTTGSGGQSINGLRRSAIVRTGSGDIAISNIGDAVAVTAGSGSLTINSIQGALDARTGSGDIRAAGIAGAFEATAGSGSIEVQQVAAGDAVLRSGSGDVRVHGLKGALSAETGSGSIRVDGEPTRTWHVSTGSGDVALTVPADASFDFDARTGSGDLRVNRTITMQAGAPGETRHNHIAGRVGKGGALLEAHTGSGSIEID